MAQIAIAKPCNEVWENMTSTTADARFCANCRKQVIDFSKMTDRQIKFLLENQPKERICGRLAASQLNRPLAVVNFEESSVPWWQRWLVAATALIGWKQMLAQEVPPPPPTIVVQDTDSTTRRVDAALIEFTGTVYDENYEPIIGAKVEIENTSARVLSDVDGKFVLKLDPLVAPEIVKVRVHYFDYMPVEKEVRLKLDGKFMPPEPMIIEMKEEELMIMGEVIYVSKKVRRREQRAQRKAH